MEYVFYLEAFCEALRDVNHVDVPNDTDIISRASSSLSIASVYVLCAFNAKSANDMMFYIY